MVPKNETYLVDHKGQKKAVVLDLEDIKYVKEYLAEETVPYGTVRKRMLRQK